MSTRVLKHLRSNVVAYLALFVALGGTSYAAITISGTQIRNHTISAVKFDRRSVAASIKAWANVQWHGAKLVAQSSSTPVRIITTNDGEGIIWTRQRFSQKRCIPSATPQVNGNGEGFNGYVTAQFFPDGSTFLNGFAPDGSRRPQAAFVLMVCS